MESTDSKFLKRVTPKEPPVKWKRWTLFCVILFIGGPQFLNHTGFCYREMRYLSEMELVDRYLFGEKADAMTYEQKVEAAKHLPFTGIAEIKYPGCCRVHGEPANLTYFDRFLNKTFGRYFYELNYNFPRSKVDVARHDSNAPYITGYSSLRACGLQKIGSGSITTSAESYSATIERNEQHWYEQGDMK